MTDLVPTSGRWTARWKAGMLENIAAGRISLTDVTALGITADELAEWQLAYEALGIHGLKATKRPRLRLVRRPRRG